MVCAGFSCSGMRFLLGNRVMRFLSAISFQFYIYHQFLAVRLRELKFVPSSSETPWSASDLHWQISFTLICFALAIILSALITYLFEKPIARAFRRKMDEK